MQKQAHAAVLTILLIVLGILIFTQWTPILFALPIAGAAYLVNWDDPLKNKKSNYEDKKWPK